ncbi:metastasis-suppressor KiSS-1 [Sturnira hondurensis]|uniref:metastasis-suppressor KiSS-1 n=1 Tax=Sturnira hondurensis TaxID=192404 RepID=UPI00187A83E6|nr:metastasis-suppressor KiSS-1 [Sturnira hondurensis]
MSLLVSWQLMLFLCAVSFRETLEKVAPMENPRSTGMCRLGKRVEGSNALRDRGMNQQAPPAQGRAVQLRSLMQKPAEGQARPRNKWKRRMGLWAGVQDGFPGLVSHYGSVLGQQRSPLPLRAAWEQSPRCTAGESEVGSRRPASCAPHSRLIPALQGAALVQREKNLPAFWNWNSFGLRYGRRRAVSWNVARRQGTSSPALTGALGTQSGRRGQALGGGLEFPVLNQ